MFKSVIIVLLLAALAVVVSASENRKVPCVRTCMLGVIKDKIKKESFPFCVEECNKHSKSTYNDSEQMLSKLNYTINFLNGIQEEEAELQYQSDFLSEEEALSESFSPRGGSYLTVTTSSLNVRSGPCTNKNRIGSLSQGSVVKFTGYVLTQCGYKWYGVQATDGSFRGTGYVASNFVKEGGSPSPKPSGKYPLFKQCDSRWKNDYISSKTVCRVGCLMSSVSMALNGLGKKLNGQTSNPGTLNRWLKGHGGYSGNLFVWGAVSRYGLSYIGQPSSTSSIRNYVSSGRNVVILNVRGGGHWVLATGLTSSGFTVNDPGYSTSSYTNGQVVRAGVYKIN